MSSHELTEWMLFDGIEPIGALRQDYNAGMLCSLMANANRRKGADPFAPSDFMPFAEKPEDALSDVEKAIEGFKRLAQGKK